MIITRPNIVILRNQAFKNKGSSAGVSSLKNLFSTPPIFELRSQSLNFRWTTIGELFNHTLQVCTVPHFCALLHFHFHMSKQKPLRFDTLVFSRFCQKIPVNFQRFVFKSNDPKCTTRLRQIELDKYSAQSHCLGEHQKPKKILT